VAESSRLLGGFFLVGVFGACLAGAANAGVLVVDGGGQGDYTDIQSALDAASDGDTILVKPGTYEIDASLDLNRLHDPASDQGPPSRTSPSAAKGAPRPPSSDGGNRRHPIPGAASLSSGRGKAGSPSLRA
jgi:hypothetical protein